MSCSGTGRERYLSICGGSHLEHKNGLFRTKGLRQLIRCLREPDRKGAGQGQGVHRPGAGVIHMCGCGGSAL